MLVVIFVGSLITGVLGILKLLGIISIGWNIVVAPVIFVYLACVFILIALVILEKLAYSIKIKRRAKQKWKSE